MGMVLWRRMAMVYMCHWEKLVLGKEKYKSVALIFSFSLSHTSDLLHAMNPSSKPVFPTLTTFLSKIPLNRKPQLPLLILNFLLYNIFYLWC